MGAVPIRRLMRIGALLKRLFEFDRHAATPWLHTVLQGMEFVPAGEREKVCKELLEGVEVPGNRGDDLYGDILTDFARVIRVTSKVPK